jgi:ABC-2 type transport system permease protein
MNKILLIIQREYLSRVKKKSFLVVTLLVPLFIMGMMSALIYLSLNQEGLADKKKVVVVDESGWYVNKLKDSKTIEYSYANNYQGTKSSFIKDGYDYLLYVPQSQNNIQLLGKKKPGPTNANTIEDDLTGISRARKLSEANIDSTLLANAQKRLSVESKEVTETGEKDAHIWAAYGLGLVCAFLIYISLFLYGAQVMRGVIEEKVSRVVEVIISSVKPFQLMLGKIIGVGMVGLTQFILWIVLTLSLSTIAGTAVIGGKGDAIKKMQTEQMAKSQISQLGESNADRMADSDVGAFLHSINSMPITEIVLCFLFYFFFGYMLYSALFAAVGSAVDSETETQQFMMPLTMPLIFTIILSQTVIVNNPDSSLSVWLSIIPFTSPIAMMIRIPFGVPAWQLAASMASMVLGFLLTTWVAARIYRVGILMYGKKASYKELAKWFMYKG